MARAGPRIEDTRTSHGGFRPVGDEAHRGPLILGGLDEDPKVALKLATGRMSAVVSSRSRLLAYASTEFQIAFL